MGLFSRRKSAHDEQVAPEADFDDLDDDLRLDSGEGLGGPEEVGAGIATVDGMTGPFDRSAVRDDSEYLNLGALWLKGKPGMELRLEVNEQEQQITGVTAAAGLRGAEERGCLDRHPQRDRQEHHRFRWHVRGPHR